MRDTPFRKQTRIATVAAVFAAIVLILNACDGTVEESPAPSNGQSVRESRATAAQKEPPTDLATLVAGNRDFAFDLYRRMAAADGNIFFSPHSISVALAMTYSGARGETERQMATTLGFKLPQKRLHPAFSSLNTVLAERGKNVDEDTVTRFRLNLINALWSQEGFDYLQEFRDNLVEHYGSGIRLVDFISGPEPSRLMINNWVAEQTEDRIQNLVSKGVINSFTRLILTNAIYFQGSWINPFDADATSEGVFYLANGQPVKVPMMYKNSRVLYAQTPAYEAVELPYVGYEISMLVVMPAAGTIRSFENSLGPETVQQFVYRFRDTELDLKLPRFEIESELQLADTLERMGMPNAFRPPGEAEGADLSGFNGKRDLFIGEVLHKAFVVVDEAGTEAAAATAAMFELQSMPDEATMVVDRPFLFLILDRKTRTILFLGRVMDPR